MENLFEKLEKSLCKSKPSYRKKGRSITRSGMTLSQCARSKNNNVPKSEQWFYSQVHKNGYSISNIGLTNVPFYDRYIPDLLNNKYKFVIEIDGSIHEKDLVKEQDKKKTDFYRSKGYSVFRVEAYNVDSFNKVFSWIKLILQRKAPRKKDIETRIKNFKNGRKSNFD